MNLTCPACHSENTQRLSVMQAQQSKTGLSGQTILAAQLGPPKKQHWFVIGLILALPAGGLVGAATSASATPWGGLIFLFTWLVVGAIGKGYEERKVQEWQLYCEAHFICLRCGQIFKPAHAPTP